MVLIKVLDRKCLLIITNHSLVFIFSIRIISEPRLQNPYLLYSNTNSHSSPYNFQRMNINNEKFLVHFRIISR